MCKSLKATMSLILLLLVSPTAFANFPNGGRPAPVLIVDSFIRTELYFGRNISNGSMVSDEEWGVFLSDVVTPRFPDGFTVIDGLGQFKGKDGRIVREPSKILIILYPKGDKRTAGVRIDEIRTEYKKRFRQESVMRMDLGKSVNVTF
jgi:hypothetical protein